jgi:hypothetical protein
MECKDCVVYLGNGTSTSCGLKFENVIICDVNLGIIVSTEDSTDCISDDEDDCITFSGAGSADDIILPTSTIITFSTPKPPDTPEPRLTSRLLTHA